MVINFSQLKGQGLLKRFVVVHDPFKKDLWKQKT